MLGDGDGQGNQAYNHTYTHPGALSFYSRCLEYSKQLCLAGKQISFRSTTKFSTGHINLMTLNEVIRAFADLNIIPFAHPLSKPLLPC